MSTLDRVRFSRPVEYPDSDGSLIAESDWHRDELFDLIYRLKERYAGRPDVYVSGHMFVYYEEGRPRQVIAPDVMVVFGVPKGQRRVYKLWEEGRPPTVVFEVSSRKTWREDRGRKLEICARLGVAEYFLWDPRYEYLTPPLQGHRLAAGTYEPIPAGADGCVASEELDLRLCVEEHFLELYDRATGERLPRPVEAARVARDVTEAERTARRVADEERAARAAAEAEVARLRAEIERLRGDRDSGM